MSKISEQINNNISDTEKYSVPQRGEYKFDKVSLDDPRVWSAFKRGDTTGIFQLEKQLGKDWAKRVKPNNIEELASLLSVVRPGVLETGMADLYAKRKNGEEPIEFFHPSLSNILKDTYGCLLYQEQTIRIARDIAGMSESEGETLRKCISGDCFLLTNCGPIRFKDLYKKPVKPKFVLSVDEQQKLKYVPLSSVQYNGKKEVVRIKTSNGFFLEVTKDHKIFTQDGWKEARLLSNNDFVAIANNHTYKGNKCSWDEAELIGYFLSEGCYTEKSGQPKITNSDHWILDRIKIITNQLFNENCISESKYENGCYDLRFKKEACFWFKNNFDKSKSRDKDIPYKYINAYYESSRRFIGAFYSGEGYVTNQGCIGIPSTSLGMLEKIQMMLLRSNIHACLNFKNTTYKNLPYKSYDLILSSRDNQSKFYWKYKDYICPTKVIELENLLSRDIEKGYSSFIVPNCYIKSITNINNMCGLVGHKETGGSLYNGNISYERLSRLNQMIGSELLDKILNAEYKFVRIDKIENIGEKDVYDFTVDDNIHAGFVNGILVHNCVGKKDPQLMHKVKTDFLKKSEENKIISRQEAEEIFSWIEKGQRYLFNFSHAVQYALNSYFSMYAKVHFPTEFYCSWLTFSSEKMDPKEEIYNLVQDARLHDVKVLPPDIRHRNVDFKIMGEKEILFGLSHIRNVGNSAIQSIEKIGDKVGTFNGFIKSVKKLKRNVAEALIKSGACDCYGISRSFMLKHIHTVFGRGEKDSSDIPPEYKPLTPNEYKCFIENFEEIGFKDALKKIIETKACIAKRIPTIEAKINNITQAVVDTNRQRSIWEKIYLGLNLTCSAADDIDKLENNTLTCKQIYKLPPKNKVVMHVVIDNIKKKKTSDKSKYPGLDYCYLDVSDNSGALNYVVCWPEKYEKFKNEMIEDSVVTIYGYKDNWNGRDQVIVNRVVNIG